MADSLRIRFGTFAAPRSGVLVVFCDDGLRLGAQTRAALGPAAAAVARAAAAERFTGRLGAALDIAAPAELSADRLVVVGLGKPKDLKPRDSLRLGGVGIGKVPSAAEQVSMLAEFPTGAMDADTAADLALGARLRAYRFDRYKTKRKDEDATPAETVTLTIGVADPAATRRAYGARAAVGDGAVLARDLVNEPPNVLYPDAFARRATALRRRGVTVEAFDARKLQKLGLTGLLAVGQGAAHESRMVVMRWNGGRKGDRPLAFIGKGVCFDSGGISIKPSA
ncbi:MAG: M17 family peptidase N-terminal domain-containing protein, partial [Xanthobacteraceae bacterium]